MQCKIKGMGRSRKLRTRRSCACARHSERSPEKNRMQPRAMQRQTLREGASVEMLRAKRATRERESSWTWEILASLNPTSMFCLFSMAVLNPSTRSTGIKGRNGIGAYCREWSKPSLTKRLQPSIVLPAPALTAQYEQQLITAAAVSFASAFDVASRWCNYADQPDQWALGARLYYRSALLLSPLCRLLALTPLSSSPSSCGCAPQGGRPANEQPCRTSTFQHQKAALIGGYGCMSGVSPS